MKKPKKLPENYRYSNECIDIGTGNGDDRYALGLQKFETRQVRVGLWPFRRTVERSGWWTVETFEHGPDQYAQAHQSAWVRSRAEA